MLVSAPEARSAEGDEGGAAALVSFAADLYQDKHTPYCHLCFSGRNRGFFRVIIAVILLLCLAVVHMKKEENHKSVLPCKADIQLRSNLQKRGYCMMNAGVYHTLQSSRVRVF